MGEYRVKWEIDIEASDPREAAELALAIQRNPESTALVFRVGGESVDLWEPRGPGAPDPTPDPDSPESFADFDEIADHFARTLFVSTFADAMEDDSEELAEWREARADQAAGPGEDWFDTVTDETPLQCRAAAVGAIEAIERANGAGIVAIAARWARGPFRYGRREHDAESFAHAAAMQWQGHGVGLGDDEPEWEPEIPYGDFSFLEWL